jgi:hypothetical protein
MRLSSARRERVTPSEGAVRSLGGNEAFPLGEQDVPLGGTKRSHGRPPKKVPSEHVAPAIGMSARRYSKHKRDLEAEAVVPAYGKRHKPKRQYFGKNQLLFCNFGENV